ncbi:hypothetical protein BDV93DRAFT_160201 [Ceratobasidium sp. AG-I]|nr:hypothetical protein BDV93DRAFT_160201 [Ceratobasidium sp. AG-I]
MPSPGVYLLRAVTVQNPNPGVGGVYATSAGIGKRIETAANTSSYADNQYWRLERAGGDTWQIIKSPPPNAAGSQAEIGGPGFTNGNVHPHAPVTLTNTASAYKLSERGGDVYVISPANHPGGVGADWVVGRSEENTLEIVSIPVIENPPPTPAWELKRQAA